MNKRMQQANKVLLLPVDKKQKLILTITKNYTVVNGCWVWNNYKNPDGYGVVSLNLNGKQSNAVVHRVHWLLTIGPIAEGLELDHLCRNRPCLNPKHLEPVTHAENMRRSLRGVAFKIKCLRGHEYTSDNTIYRNDGARQCRKCTRLRLHLYSRQKTSYYHKNKEHVLAVQKARRQKSNKLI